jgi:hypothetical protein
MRGMTAAIAALTLDGGSVKSARSSIAGGVTESSTPKGRMTNSIIEFAVHCC